MTVSPWPGEWLRGVLDVCVLAVLEEGPTYGYAVSARLDELGLGAVKGGTLYPLLARLEQGGLVTTQWRPGDGGPGRKYFALTPQGHRELVARGESWRAFAALTSTITTGAGHGTTGTGHGTTGTGHGTTGQSTGTRTTTKETDR